MKKQIKCGLLLILVLVTLSSLVLPVFADMGAPMIEEYDVIVNPGGTVTREGIAIPEGTVLTISFEYREGGKYWGETEYNGNRVSVNIADVTNGDIIPEEAGDEPYMSHCYQVVFEEGVDVYAGPGYGYKKLFTVPYGERMTSSTEMGSWTFVRYGEQKGWVYSYESTSECGLAIYLTDGPVNIWTMEETDIISGFERNSVVVGHIPKDTVISSELRTFRGNAYYITYEGMSGWVYAGETFSVATGDYPVSCKAGSDGILYLFDRPEEDINAFPEPSDTLSIKSGEVIDAYYRCGDRSLNWYYVDKDGKLGWYLSDYYYDDDDAERIMKYVPDFFEYERTDDKKKEAELHYPDYVTVYSEKKVEKEDTENIETEKPDGKTLTENKKATNQVEEKNREGLFEDPVFIIVFCLVCAAIIAIISILLLKTIKEKKK